MSNNIKIIAQAIEDQFKVETLVLPFDHELGLTCINIEDNELYLSDEFQSFVANLIIELKEENVAAICNPIFFRQLNNSTV